MKKHKPRHGRQPLGQHFLSDIGAREEIVNSLRIGPEDNVLEIGPGEGALTSLVMDRGKSLTLVEADPRLAQDIARHYPSATVINAKAEETDFSALPGPLVVMGNLPYYASVPIFKRLTEQKSNIARMALMFQKEVALRIIAPPGQRSYGSLSVYSSFHWEMEGILTLKPSSFSPPPKVDSMVIYFTPRRLPPVEGDEKKMFELVRLAFTHKRRTLRNNLKENHTSQAIESALEKTGLGPNARAEELGLEQFAALLRALGEN